MAERKVSKFTPKAMHKSVFIAGTFDGIHKGHESLLRRAFREGKAVTIGLTPDAFIQKFKSASRGAGSGSARQLAKYAQRKQALEQWLLEQGKRATVIPIQDAHEPAASMPDIDAIVVSSDTAFRAGEINELRRKRGLKELSILEVPMVEAEDKKPISSTRMQNGEIDRNGRLIMPDSMRDELAQPLGIVLSGSRIAEVLRSRISLRETIISVGDVATETLVKHGVIPSLAIIDQKVGRRPYDSLKRLPGKLLESRMSVVSGPGYIAKDAIIAIKQWAKNPKTTLLVVDGEEDLLALPAIAYVPLGNVVFYGQPQEGLVQVIVTKEKKQEVLALLAHFT